MKKIILLSTALITLLSSCKRDRLDDIFYVNVVDNNYYYWEEEMTTILILT